MRLTCREVVETVTDYVEGVMPERDRAVFEDHLRICADCERYLEQMKQSIQATGELVEKDVSPEALAALSGAFRAWKQRRSDEP